MAQTSVRILWHSLNTDHTRSMKLVDNRRPTLKFHAKAVVFMSCFE